MRPCCCVYQEWSLKWFNVEKLRRDDECGEWSRSRDSGEQQSRCLTVPVGRVNGVSSELLGPRWLPVSSYEHLLMKYGSLGVEKSAAAADSTAPAQRQRASNVDTDEELGLIMTSRQRHLLLNPHQRRRLRTCRYRPAHNDK